ncbi:hypothetical protein [Denitratimonas sp. CY0512]|uniref:hypothetical protein n=1 Tax=Denitratimonas sp. CY0512 TaxID=3131940 RepID=UPI0030AEE00C
MSHFIANRAGLPVLIQVDDLHDFLVSSQTEDGAAAAHFKRQEPRHMADEVAMVMGNHRPIATSEMAGWA